VAIFVGFPVFEISQLRTKTPRLEHFFFSQLQSMVQVFRPPAPQDAISRAASQGDTGTLRRLIGELAQSDGDGADVCGDPRLDDGWTSLLCAVYASSAPATVTLLAAMLARRHNDRGLLIDADRIASGNSGCGGIFAVFSFYTVASFCRKGSLRHVKGNDCGFMRANGIFFFFFFFFFFFPPAYSYQPAPIWRIALIRAPGPHSTALGGARRR
jgi:hypothetical protein